MVRLTDRPDMTLDVYRGRKTTIQQKKTTKSLSQNIVGAYIMRFYIQHPSSQTTDISKELFWDQKVYFSISVICDEL